MKILLNDIWKFFLPIQLILHYVQTQTIENISEETLAMDEAYLTISNKNYTDPILFTSNVIACEHCEFDKLPYTIPYNTSRTIKIDTQHPYDCRIFAETINITLVCEIKSYSFSEHGSYLFEISQMNENENLCTIELTKDTSYYWIPVICAILYICCLVLIIQLYHHIYNSRYVGRILTNIGHQRVVNTETSIASPGNSRRGQALVANEVHNEDNLPIEPRPSITIEAPLVGSTRLSNNTIRITRLLPKRLRGLDTFRGFALMIMIFVNYGGGGYWFFDHSIWNGLTLADLVFPWFVWMMGVSVVLSQRSLLKKKVSKLNIFLKICRRTVILFFLGLLLQGGYEKPKNIRILGVLQRLALCYFFTAVLVLIFDDAEDELHSSQWPIGDDVHQPIRDELVNTIFHFWPQWLCILFITLAWILITFVPKIDGCPRGYVGPGGKHYHGKYFNCTGGVAGYLDRHILGNSHLYNDPTCKDIYHTEVPYDPEGLLGILTGTLLCYLGVQAAHSFVYSTRVRRVCTQWIVSGLICGFLGLLLSKGGHSESWIPINKNLWSLSFIFVLSSLAFIILTILYLLVDVYQLFTGEPWLWLGMNSIVIYCGHELCSDKFPIQFQVNHAHSDLLALHVYGVTCWIVISGIMYYKKIFIAI